VSDPTLSIDHARISPTSRGERRRGIRIESALRVEVTQTVVGTLVDLNEFGALIDLPAPFEPDSRLSFDVFWEGSPIRLHGRVVRSTPSYERDSRLTWGEPSGYHVAVEFFDTATQSVIKLHQAVQTRSDASE
jgi:hypothetical protein